MLDGRKRDRAEVGNHTVEKSGGGWSSGRRVVRMNWQALAYGVWVLGIVTFLILEDHGLAAFLLAVGAIVLAVILVDPGEN